MLSRIARKLKTVVLFLLILGMIAPIAALAAPPYDEGARWHDLPVIEPLDIDWSQFPELQEVMEMHNMPSLFDDLRGLEGLDAHEVMEALAALSAEEQTVAVESLYRLQNELSEPDPEVLTELMRQQMETWTQDSRLHRMAEFTLLINSGGRFSQLDADDQDLIFNQLNIAHEARSIGGLLFATMEGDGYTLADSVELIRIMGSGLFGYAEAQTILTMLPSSRERMAEITRFEQFAQLFDIDHEVDARRLVSRPGETEGRTLGGINLFMTSGSLDDEFSFVDALQSEGWERTTELPPEIDIAAPEEDVLIPELEAEEAPEPEEYLPEIEMIPDYDESDDAIGLESLPQMPEAYDLNGYDELELLEHEYYLHDVAMQDYELELHENYEILQELEEGEEEAEDYPPVPEEYLPEEEEEEHLPEEEIYIPGRDELLPEMEALLPDLLDAPYAHAVNTVFTSAQAFNEARRMFLGNHSAAEIEAAFALGAALQAEPRMFLLQPGIYRASMETSFGDAVSREALAARPTMLESRETLTEYMTFEVAVPAASRGNEIQAHNERGARETITLPSLPIITPNRYALDNALPITVENRHTEISHPFDIDAVNLNSRASNDELAEIMAYGDAIMSLGQEQVQAIAPLSEPQRPLVVNPFTIDFSASESVSINTGAAMYRTHILSLPGRGGFGFNLDLLYSSARADYETLILMDGQMPLSEPIGVDALSATKSQAATYHANLFETNWFYIDGRLLGSNTTFTRNRTWISSDEAQAGLEDATGYSWDYVTIDSQPIQVLTQRWADTWQSSELVASDAVSPAYIPIMPLFNSALPRRNLHGLGAGWIFDLPYILDHVLYVPGRGSFALNGNTIVGYTLNDMTLRNYQGYFGGLWSDRRLDFHNGTSYFFNGQHVIAMRDRFGNTIRFYYTYTQHFQQPHFHPERVLSQIIDSAGQRIQFSHTIHDHNHRSITITAPDNTTYVINMQRVYEDFVVSSIRNQVGTTTTFNHHVASFRYDFYTPANIGEAWSRTALLHWVNYPSGGRLNLGYAYAIVNMGIHGYRLIYRVNARVLHGNGREFLRTYISYEGDHTGRSGTNGRTNIDRPEEGYYYTVTIRQNNGLRTIYTFNHRHLNTQQRTYTIQDVFLSARTMRYNDDRLPIYIRSYLSHYPFQRVTQEIFEYNRYGQITMALSPLAMGNRSLVRYQTIFEYDSEFGLQTRRIFMTDAHTTIIEENILSGDRRQVIRSYITQNNARLSRTDFFHDQFGNVTEIRAFPNSNSNAFYSTFFFYPNGLSLPYRIMQTNVRDTFGNLAAGTGIIERGFMYDVMGRVILETDPNSYPTTFQYDGIGRVTRIEHPDGGIETFTYTVNSWQNTIYRRTVLGAIYVYRYDALGNLIHVDDPFGNRILTNHYDNRIRIVDTFGNRYILRRQYVYDLHDRVVQEQFLWFHSVIGRVTTHYHDIYDPQLNSRIVTIQEGTSTDAPSIWTFVQHDRFGRLTQEGTIGGQIFTYDNDIIGRVIRERSLGIDNTFTHNIHGVTSIRNVNGHTANNEFDHMGRIIRSFCFRGFYQRFVYDALGRLIRHYEPMFAHANGTSHHTVTTYMYDRNGNLARTATLINDQFHSQQWAETINIFRYNRLMSTITGDFSGNAITTGYTYDLAGNILTHSIFGHIVSSFTYDQRGRLIRETDALGNTQTFTYDPNSLLIQRTDRNGVVFSYTYNGMGQNDSIRIDNGTGNIVEVLTFYNFNRSVLSRGLIFEFFFNFTAEVFSYDAQGRVIRRTEQSSSLGSGAVIHTYSYNEANNITQFVTTVDGAPQTWQFIEYDIAQRPSRVSDVWHGTLATYAYDANGNRIRSTTRYGTVSEYTFNPGNLVTRVVNRHGDTILSQFDYTYFFDGNVHTVTEQFQETARNRTVTYSYDLARRLTSEETTGHGAGVRVFTFDTRGNRASMIVRGQQNYTVNYTYDANNRLIREVRTGDGAQTSTFTYDRNGNQLTRTTGNTVETRTYNVFNQLTRVTRPGLNAEYSYRVDGLRHRRDVNGWRTYQIWNQGQLTLELNANRQVINMYYVALVANHRIRSRHHNFYLFNARGDVVQRVDGHGNVLHTYQYDAFGNSVFELRDYEPFSDNPFRFAGEFYDWETGEYYLRARSYNPRLGRFTQPDPFWNVGNMQSSNAAVLQSANLYVYTVNNPVRWVDPSGLAKEPTFKSIHGGSGGVVLGMGALMAVNSMTRGHESMAARAAAATDTIAAAVVDSGRNAARALTNLYRAVTDVIARPSPPEALPDIGAAGSSTVTAIATTEQEMLAAMGDILERTGTRDEHGREYRFFTAYIHESWGGVVPKVPLTLYDARNYILSINASLRNQGVFAFSHADAVLLTIMLGGPHITLDFPDGRPAHRDGGGGPGFFMHFNPNDAPHTHIWFLW